MKKEDIITQIKNSFIEIEDIISAYIYGSFITKEYDTHKSDIDLLFIVKDSENPQKIINKIAKKKEDLKNLKMDINIVFYSEFKKRYHIYRPPTYFLGIKYCNIILFGKDLLSEVSEKEIDPEKIYKRAVDLAQSSRGIYINSKNEKFWKNKYIKWLRVLSLEILYLYGEFELSFEKGFSKLINTNKEFRYLRFLKKDSLELKQINRIAEELKDHVYKNFIK